MHGHILRQLCLYDAWMLKGKDSKLLAGLWALAMYGAAKLAVTTVAPIIL